MRLSRYRLKSALLITAVWVSRSMAATDPMDAKCNAILEQALADKNPDTRKQAVVALSLAATREPFLSRLTGMLRDKDVEVRLAAVTSLSEVNNRTARTALHEALADEVPEVSFAAAKALWALHDPAGKKALMAVLEGENKTSSSFFSAQKRQALRMVHTPRTMLLFAVKQGVGFAPVPGLGGGLASMQALLTDPGVSGRATAALLVGKEKDPATLEALKDALNDKDWSVRAAAVHSLALRNDPALKKDLGPLLEDKKEAVRMRSAAGYLRLSAIQSSRTMRTRVAPVAR
jgi:HEAT repeat protein